MNTELDLSNYDKIVANAKEHPKGTLLNANTNDLRVIACAASDEIYSELMKELEGNKEAQKMLNDFGLLTFVHYQFEDVTIGHLDELRKIVLDMWSKPRKSKA